MQCFKGFQIAFLEALMWNFPTTSENCILIEFRKRTEETKYCIDLGKQLHYMKEVVLIVKVSKNCW